MRRRLLRALVCTAAITAWAEIAPAQEPSAERLVELMVGANRGWLTSAPESLSYRLAAEHLPVDGAMPAGRASPTAWDYREVVAVQYRAPRHLRAESDRGTRLLLPDGRGFRLERSVEREEWDADRVLRYLYGIGYCGAAWALAHDLGDWELGDPAREVIDGLDCYRLHGTRKTPPPERDRQVLVQEWYQYDAFDLWLEAEGYRPVREGLARGEHLAWWARYLDYRPIPDGGQAPMRIEVYGGTTDEYLPDTAPRSVYQYALIDGQAWFLQRWHDLLWSVTVTEAALDPVPIPVFYDAATLDMLSRVAWLEQELETHQQLQRWNDVLKTCVEITRAFPQHHKANAIVWMLYFWHGDYDKAIAAAELAMQGGQRVTGGIYLAWAYDAAGRREDALQTYRTVIGLAPNEESAAAAQAGLEQPWTPVGKRLRAGAEEVMVKKGRRWRVEASHNQAASALVIDGDRRTRWVSGAPQEPGMWVSVDLGETTTVSRVVFDHIGDLTMHYQDYPRRYVVEVSPDGEAWEQVGEGSGCPDGLVEARFEPRSLRQVRIRQEGSVRPYQWSVHEVYLYAPSPRPGP
ncbi:hypothetical protein AMK68_03265 [candidate division KD3-62 bacterium DG_56]|uniref:F5/8 type C domain-containing protein n=1 Tax=candidate division KD3-62 bacterium DG_56 TaxID=1704032 RepID=A0A0S7XNC8_9BACT|nr:MAG: hypothetical protein AMK68_03265 [candidate division KD3-62 bacterium DG_56]